MAAPVVIRLSERISRSRDAEERAICEAMLASYFARIGQFEQAEALRVSLRRDFNDGRSLRVTVRLMCLEALLLYFRDLSPLSRDRLSRAHLLAKASGDQTLVALTSSWLAHIDFNLNKFESMADALCECATAVGPDDAEAECRSAIVLGDAFTYAGERARARLWYERGRRLAVGIGDHAFIGALTYNAAALHVASLRLIALQSEVPADELTLAANEVQSAVNYQLVAGLNSLDHLLHTARIGVLALRHQYAEAARLGLEVLEREHVPRDSAQEHLLKADVAAGLGRSSRLDDCHRWIEQIPLEKVLGYEPDDQAIILGNLSDAYASCGQSKVAEELHDRALGALGEHESRVARVRAILERLWHSLPGSQGSA